MNRRKLSLLMLVTALSVALAGSHFAIATAEKPPSKPPYLDPSLPVEKRVKDLLKRMTLEEKVGQMTQINVTRLMGEDEWDRGPLNEEWMKKVFVDNHVGSILSGGGAAPVPNTPEEWAKMTNTLQRYALQHSRLKIPIIYGVDAVHGHNNVLGATIYPHNIGLANSWNPSLVREINERTAKEVRATGIHWNFAPDADIGRDLRWGRYYETFGEDPLLASEMVGAAVAGLEGDKLSSSDRVAASVKHYVGYSQPLNGEDRAPADLSLRTLREIFLPPFERAVQDGAETIMVNSGSVNGIPVHASEYLLKDVLRKELGFQGVVVSDWEDIIKLHTVHKIAPTYKEAIRISINAGVDMSMVPLDAEGFTKNLIELVKEKKVSEKRIDEAVSRILTLKFRLGLFENPYVDEKKAKEIIVDQADRELARRAATQSITLLKNEKNLLPLKKDLSTVLVTGPSADNPANQMGGWTIGWQGVENPDEMPPAVTLLEGIKGKVSKNTRVLYEPGVPPEDQEDDPEAVEKAIRKAVNAAKRADVVIVAVGEKPYAEGEGNTSTAALPSAQTKLIQALKNTGKDVVVVLVAGRPLMMTETIESVPAFLMAYLPGTEGGSALADILFGDANPSGKLASTWPKRIGQVPTFYNRQPGASYDPLFPFGYGLSYTSFRYENFQVPKSAKPKGALRVSVTVTNTGKRAGDEIVQVYADRQYQSVLSPVERLVAFQRISLKPGESKRVTLDIPVSRLSVIPGDILGTEKRVVEPGTYQLRVGDLTKTFTISK
ncbi:MAG: glycoside hydrolase family 3 N-terminal domain-containing protein [Planifilum fimeticola]